MSVDTAFERRQKVKRPGWQKALPWLAGAALVAALIGGLIWKFGTNTGHSYATPIVNKPAKDVSQVPPTTRLDPAAKTVAKQFILTAVARKNLRAAYVLAGPQIRQGQTLKEWMTGNIAVIPYPLDELAFAPMKVDFSFPREAQIEVALLPKKGAKVRPQLFIADLIKTKAGKWQVNSWVPRSSPPVPNGSANNGAGQ
jgi:hypothetical protein